ncbi:hypothetical protein [Actinacidiphila glaucinigra]|uniref:hypothetical protein n=1 Tax=Actinacidiphila glaucinigra TaxID=235986 RepID=UPI003D929E3B
MTTHSDSPRVDARNANGAQIGDGGTQHNNWYVSLGLGVVAVIGVAGVVLAFTLRNVQVMTSSDTSKTSASAAVPPAPEPTTSRPRSTPPATDTPTPSAASATATATTATDPASPGFDPASLDDATTDRTPATVTALLPAAFTDSKGVRYRMNSGGVQPCGRIGASGSEVNDVLADGGCADSNVTGTYVDTGGNILISVVVLPLPDNTAALNVYSRLKNSPTNDWSYWCPTSGTGSNVCHDSRVRQASQLGYTGWNHRYLMHTVALYVGLQQDSGLMSWLVAASQQALVSAGPQNYAGNQL